MYNKWFTDVQKTQHIQWHFICSVCCSSAVAIVQSELQWTGSVNTAAFTSVPTHGFVMCCHRGLCCCSPLSNPVPVALKRKEEGSDLQTKISSFLLDFVACSFPTKAASLLTSPQMWGRTGCPPSGQSCITEGSRVRRTPQSAVTQGRCAEVQFRNVRSVTAVFRSCCPWPSALLRCPYQTKIFLCICILNHCWHISQIFPLWSMKQEFDLQTDHSSMLFKEPSPCLFFFFCPISNDS